MLMRFVYDVKFTIQPVIVDIFRMNFTVRRREKDTDFHSSA